MKALLTISFLLCLLGANLDALAQAQSHVAKKSSNSPPKPSSPANTPPLSQILAWFGDQLKTYAHTALIRTVNSSQTSYENTWSLTKIDGCTITIEDLYTVSRPSNAITSKGEYTVDLSKLNADASIESQTENYCDSGDCSSPFVKLTSATKSVRFVFTYNIEEGNSPKPPEWANALHFPITKPDMAVRVSHALHDAIVSCGGTSVPPNLY
jgi:hypothetical protein